MRGTKAKMIRRFIKQYRIDNPKASDIDARRLYRKIKNGYNRTPRNERHLGI